MRSEHTTTTRESPRPESLRGLQEEASHILVTMSGKRMQEGYQIHLENSVL